MEWRSNRSNIARVSHNFFPFPRDFVGICSYRWVITRNKQWALFGSSFRYPISSIMRTVGFTKTRSFFSNFPSWPPLLNWVTKSRAVTKYVWYPLTIASIPIEINQVCLSNPRWAEKKDIFFSVNTRQRKQLSNPSLIQRGLRGKIKRIDRLAIRQFGPWWAFGSIVPAFWRFLPLISGTKTPNMAY